MQISEQDNEHPIHKSPLYQAVVKAGWSERVSGLTPQLFSFIYEDHKEKTSARITPGVKTVGEVARSLGMDGVNGRADWYVEPTKAVYTTVQKLSKGFNLGAEGIAPLFKDDGYIGSDIRGVLESVEPASDVVSNRIGFSCSHFIYACTPYIPETFFTQGKKEIRDMYDSFSLLRAFAWNEADQCETTLTTIHMAQKYGRVMPQVGRVLTSSKHINLATIADRFTQRFAAIERNTIATATRDMKVNAIG